MDLLSQSALLVGITSFGLGSSVLARNVKNKLFLAFAGLMAVVSAWAITFFLEKIWGGGSFYRWHLFFNLWIAPLGLTVIRVLVRIQDRLSRRLLDLTTLLSLVLSVALLFHYEEDPWILQVVYFVPAMILLQILELMWIDRRIRIGFKRRPKAPTVGFARRNIIYVGGLLVLCTSVMDHVPWMGRLIPFFGNLGLTVYLFFVSRAITQQRLLNFGALVSRFLVLLAIAFTLTAVYSMLFAWIQNSTPLFFLNSFIVSFLLLTLLEPIRSLVSYLTQRLLTQKHLRLQEVLREAQRKLTGIIDPGALFQAIFQTMELVLSPRSAALFVLRRDGTKFRRVRSYEAAGESAENEPAVREIIVDHPLLEYCAKLHKRGDLPVLLDQIIESELDRSTSRSQRESLAALIQGLRAFNSNLLIPLFDQDRILGFVTLNVPEPPEPWGGNWGLLSTLFPYFERVAQTLRGMEIYVRQREKERLAALGEMAAGLAHEIRNPLGAIKGAAQFLDPSADRPESRFLGIIVEEVDRLNRVVTQFLDYSKPPATDLNRCDVAELVGRVVEFMKTSKPEHVQLVYLPPREAVKIVAAPEQIRQVLLNLIQNSMKAVEENPEGQIRVSVEVEGHDVNISVEDDGKGIKKEHLDKLFIPFFTTSPSGTGLGLPISQKIVEAHRGRIDVASEEGRFARFSVILPIATET